MGKPFKTVDNARPGRSVFDLSYSKLLTCDMGQLIPVMCDEVIPGDKFDIGNQIVIRFQPLVAPVLHEINCFVHYFFVPYRILWDDWEDFITGGVLGDDASVLPRQHFSGGYTLAGSLWDFFGYPTTLTTDPQPSDFPRRAYLKIYNDFYRDETLQIELDITDQANYAVLNRNWEKDYFTSALLWQQRGTAPALPIAGTSSAVFDFTSVPDTTYVGLIRDAPAEAIVKAAGGDANAAAFWNHNTVDLSSANAFTIADLRLAFQIQKFMERNARCGVRYTEFLRAHFGVSPRDERLQRPEYIGGTKSPVIISEVLQTSESSTTPQGTMAGHGLTASGQFAGSYFVSEFGLIMGVMSVMPKPMYSQGINRQWMRSTRYDFPFPEFSTLSEQEILTYEIWAQGDSLSLNTPFGFQGRFDELRYKPNMVVSGMRNTFNYWHLGREFSAAPTLDDTFIQCVPRKDIFAVPSEPGLIVSFGNIIKAIRPIPVSAEPGLIDHH